MRKLAVLLALGLVLGACGRVAQNVAENVAEKVAENQTGAENVDIQQNEGTIKVEVQGGDQEGTISVGAGEVQEDFHIPLPDGGEVQTVLDITQNGERVVNVTVAYPLDRYDELVSFYKDWADGLPGDTQVSITSGSYQNAIFVNDTEGVSVTVAPGDDSAVVTAVSRPAG